MPSETRKDTRIRKYTRKKRKPLRGKENGEIDDVMGMGRKKKIKNLLEGSLTVALPWKGEGVPLAMPLP